MFNYQRRILFSAMIASLLSIGLFVILYESRVHTSNYDYICMVGDLSENAPNEFSTIIEQVGRSAPNPASYQKGISALASLGYGDAGLSYFEHKYSKPSFYIIACLSIILVISWMAFYVIHPINKLHKVLAGLIFDIEHAMTRYPVKFETYETNVAIFNRLTGQITALINQLNHQIELLNMAQKDRTVFIENISHQIKTPLTCISLDLELLEGIEDTNKISFYTDSCYTQIDHIEALINRLLKIGKLESGKIHYEFLEHNLLDTISVLCSTLEGQYPDKKVTLNYDKEEDYTISYDIVWLYEALENIAKNCYLYSYDNEGVEISLTRYENYIKIILLDHGIGIPMEDLPNIFDRFYRSDQNSNQTGFGIGLNLAKLVIEGHHGTIFAQSDNQSTQFVIHLPIII